MSTTIVTIVFVSVVITFLILVFVMRSAMENEDAIATDVDPNKTAASGGNLKFIFHLIHLPDMADRLTSFLRECSKSDVRGVYKLDMFSAIDVRANRPGPGLATALAQLPAHVSRKLLVEQSQGYRDHDENLTMGALGCYLSHLGVWDKIARMSPVNDDVQHIVFEDDATLHPQFLSKLSGANPLPEDWDIVLLGHICLKCEPSPTPGWMVIYQFYQTHCYVIKASSAARLLPVMTPITKQIDAHLGYLARQGMVRIYAWSDGNLSLQSQTFVTTIQTPVLRK